MGAPCELDPALQEVVDFARRAFYPDAVAILLYGSALTGQRNAASDIDLFVVLPEGDEMHERRFSRDGNRFQCTAVPSNALPHLADLSLRAGRPIGLIGLAEGAPVFGAVPGLESLQTRASATLATLNTRAAKGTERSLRLAVETAEAALAADGPGGLALALRAVPMLLEVALQRAADDHKSTRSRYRDLAAAAPDMVADHAAVAAAAAGGDMAPLADLTRKLRAEIGPEPENLLLRRLSLTRLLNEQPSGSARH